MKFEDAVNALKSARTQEQLDKIWKSIENVPFGAQCGEISKIYHERCVEFSENELEPAQVPRDSSERRTLWESRIEEFRNAIRDSELKEATAKSVVKRYRQRSKVLCEKLNELLDQGSEHFEIDTTPLLTIAEQDSIGTENFSEEDSEE